MFVNHRGEKSLNSKSNKSIKSEDMFDTNSLIAGRKILARLKNELIMTIPQQIQIINRKILQLCCD